MDEKTMARIRELEKQRESGKSVPELDALYEQVDRREQAGYKAATQPMKPASAASGPVRKMAAGGSASKRADGCAMRGKTRGKLV
jgi:hypothetical protein